MNFYSVIIGTELLNGRRKDKHFDFLNKELLKRGWMHKGSFIIKDEPHFIETVYKLIQEDPKGVMFSFGGIGATPDDYSRKCAANVFRDAQMEENPLALQAILERFGDEAYPHRVQMAYLPINSKLLHNPISNVPGFHIDNKYFFVPGFPHMAQAMILEALDTYYPKNKDKIFRYTLTAYTSENDFIDIMKTIDSHVDFSSLPIMENEKRYTVLSVASTNKELSTQEFSKFVSFCEINSIRYELIDKRQYTK